MTSGQIGFLNFARLVLDALVAADVTYLVGGAVALWAWGQPRTTEDFDLVINLPFEQVYKLSKELAQRDMLVPPETIVDLLLKPEGDVPINAIHLKSNLKAEFFLLRAGDTFRENALARRTLVDLGPVLGEVYVHAPEDLILNKIQYYAISYQSKHVRDIGNVMTVSRSLINVDYINQWVRVLQLDDAWQDIQEQIANRRNKAK